MISAKTGLPLVWLALFRQDTFTHQIGDRGTEVPAIASAVREIAADHVLGGELHIYGSIGMDAKSVLKECGRGEGPATATVTLVSNAVDARGPLRPGVEGGRQGQTSGDALLRSVGGDGLLELFDVEAEGFRNIFEAIPYVLKHGTLVVLVLAETETGLNLIIRQVPEWVLLWLVRGPRSILGMNFLKSYRVPNHFVLGCTTSQR